MYPDATVYEYICIRIHRILGFHFAANNIPGNQGCQEMFCRRDKGKSCNNLHWASMRFARLEVNAFPWRAGCAISQDESAAIRGAPYQKIALNATVAQRIPTEMATVGTVNFMGMRPSCWPISNCAEPRRLPSTSVAAAATVKPMIAL